MKFFENFYFLKDDLKEEIIDRIRRARIGFVELDEKFVVKDEESLKLWIESDDYRSSISETKKEENKHTHKKKKEPHINLSMDEIKNNSDNLSKTS